MHRSNRTRASALGPGARRPKRHNGVQRRRQQCLHFESRLFPTGSFPSREDSASVSKLIFYLASGVGPAGEGENTIAMFDQRGARRTPRLVHDPPLIPLDLTVAPKRNIVVASECPCSRPRLQGDCPRIRALRSAVRPRVRT